MSGDHFTPSSNLHSFFFFFEGICTRVSIDSYLFQIGFHFYFNLKLKSNLFKQIRYKCRTYIKKKLSSSHQNHFQPSSPKIFGDVKNDPVFDLSSHERYQNSYH